MQLIRIIIKQWHASRCDVGKHSWIETRVLNADKTPTNVIRCQCRHCPANYQYWRN